MITAAPPAGRWLLLMAALIAALLAPTPAAGGEATATMTVRARVVDRCRVELPDAVPPHARIPDHVGDVIEQRCRGRSRPRITTGPPPGRPGGRGAPSDVARRHDGRGHVLITFTY